VTRGFSPARGEPRPVHITWIATCRVYNSVVAIRRITPGLSSGYENPTVDQSTVFPSHWDLGGAVVRVSRPRSTLCQIPEINLNLSAL
jgi:hypothetical protein